MTIGTVIFDLAGVVCRFGRERRITALVDGVRSAGLAAIHFAAADGLDPVRRLVRDLRTHGLLA